MAKLERGREKNYLHRRAFARPAGYLAQLWMKRAGSAKQLRLKEELQALSGGRKDALRGYYEAKIADLLFAMLLVLLLCAAVCPLLMRGSSAVPENRIYRGDYNGSSRQEELLAAIEGESEAEEISLEVHQQTYSAQEVQGFLSQAEKELEEGILGNNPSRDTVREALWFPSNLQDGRVQTEYLTVPYGMIDMDGTICGSPDAEGSLVEIKVTLRCQEVSRIYETAVMVYPPILSEREALFAALRDLTGQAEEESRSDSYLVLPKQIDGRYVTWQYPRPWPEGSAVFLLLLFPPLLFLGKDEQIHRRARERERQLMLDYPDLLWKITMLLGAGLTIRGCITRVASAYAKDSQKNGRRRYVYEELLYTCREMQSGVPESTSYENFGRRCGLPEYIKLGGLLSQNLRKGSSGLAATLQQEAALARENRIMAARKLGEQAGTRMLFPMILMLGVVLVILMVPALMVMG